MLCHEAHQHLRERPRPVRSLPRSIWLSREHPDPYGLHLYGCWLIALQWYLNERIKQREGWRSGGHSHYADMSDEQIMDDADFGVFIDFACMHQHDHASGAQRTDTESLLFAHALSSLDLIYGHPGMVTFITSGVSTEAMRRYPSLRPYDRRGWVRLSP